MGYILKKREKSVIIFVIIVTICRHFDPKITKKNENDNKKIKRKKIAKKTRKCNLFHNFIK